MANFQLSKKINLLVSVRNEQEASIAARCKVPIIDLKEPSRGSLGAVDQEIASGIAKQPGIAGNHLLSVALGELMDWHSPSGNESMDQAWLKPFDFAKTGLARAGSRGDWRSIWLRWASCIREHCLPVLVAYADFRTCDAPHPEDVARFACSSKPAYWLIDTSSKDKGNLLDHVEIAELKKWFAILRRGKIGIAVAGSLNLKLIEIIAALRPDVVAVRGAACSDNQRNNPVCASQLASLSRHVERLSANVETPKTNKKNYQANT